LTSGFHAGSFAPASGLGVVRALSGLGCGCAANPEAGVGSFMESVKSPLGVCVILSVAVFGYVMLREAIR
jgi:hypothetical protein